MFSKITFPKILGIIAVFSFYSSTAICQPDISLVTFANGFSNPVDIVNCGDERLFIVERQGLIRILDADGNELPEPFLDIDDMVSSSPNERGLLGLAFHPDYLDNGYFYINYTQNGGDTKISQLSVLDADPNKADPTSEVVLLEQNQPFWNHNGGCIKFGPDGYLYTTLGDGGSGNDPQGNGQNRQTFLGKMLRIDVDNGTPYAIPPDNPFVGQAATRDEIWALGLRNVWRFSFDQVTGDIWMGDVGQNNWEEIDFQPASSSGGENYGWRCYEGDHSFLPSGCDPIADMTFPVFEYANSFSVGCSVTGGIVYRGCEFPGLFGHYIFADYCSGRFWSIVQDENGDWNTTEIANLNDNNFSAFGENSAGEMFVAGHGNGVIAKITSGSSILTGQNETCAGQTDGSISFNIPTDQLAIVSWDDGSSETTRTDLSPGTYSVEVTTSNACVFNEEVEISAGAPYPDPPLISLDQDSILSTDPGAASYQWFLNGDPILGATSTTYTAVESGDYTVTIVSAAGCDATSEVISITITSTEAEQLGFQMASLSPNPFENNVQLNLMAAQNIDFELVISDAKGSVFKKENYSINGSFHKNFNLQNLPAGIYFLTVKTNKGEWSEKLVKK